MSTAKARDRQFISRTILISIVAIIIFGILIALLATRFGPVAPFLDFIGPVATGVLAIFLLTLMFIGLIVMFGNLREWYGERAGWFEVIILWVIILVVAIVGFGWLHALLTGLLCIGVIYYIHAAQD
jgi:hypothetical protein